LKQDSENLNTYFIQHNAFLKNLLTLGVLVQNRRKYRSQVLIFAGLSYVFGTADSAHSFLRQCQGNYDDDDDVFRYELLPRKKVTCMGVPWNFHLAGCLRAAVFSINSIEVQFSMKLPHFDDLKQGKLPSCLFMTIGRRLYCGYESEQDSRQGKDVSYGETFGNRYDSHSPIYTTALTCSKISRSVTPTRETRYPYMREVSQLNHFEQPKSLAGMLFLFSASSVLLLLVYIS